MWYGGPNAIRNAIDSAKFHSRSHRAVIRVYDAAGNVIETHKHAGEFKESEPIVLGICSKTKSRYAAKRNG
jgi:hypothetical protein